MYYFKTPTSLKETIQRAIPLAVVATSLYYNRDFKLFSLHAASLAGLTSFSLFSGSQLYNEHTITATTHGLLKAFHSQSIDSILYATRPTFGLSLPIPNTLYNSVSRDTSNIIITFCALPQNISHYKKYTDFASNMVSKSLFWYFLENGKGSIYSLGMACAARSCITLASSIPYYLKKHDFVSSVHNSIKDAARSCVIESIQDSLRLILTCYFTPTTADKISSALDSVLTTHIEKQIEQYI